MTGSRITDRLKALRERAGYTIRDFARAVGYGEKFSSYRTYETTYKKEVLPLGMVKAMVPVLSGRGTPPITANEVWNLAGVSAGESGLTATARRAHPPAGAPSGPATRSGMGTGYATGHDMGHTMGAGPGGGFGGGSRDESRPGSVEGYGEGYGGHLEGDSGRNSGAAPASGHGAGGEPPPATGANASSHPAQPRSRSLPQPLPSQVAIPEYDVITSAGPGTVPVLCAPQDGLHPVEHWNLPRSYIASFTETPDSLAIIRVAGDSMEPDYQAGDRVLVDTAHQIPSPPGVYVLWDGFGLVLKRLELLPGTEDPRLVRIMSINPAYSTYELTLDEISINGRVVGKWTWK